MGSYPWKIETGDAPEPGEAACGITTEVQEMPPDARQAVQEGLSFRYPHAAATVCPSKRTATDRKGRLKDAEAAEKAVEECPVPKASCGLSVRFGKPERPPGVRSVSNAAARPVKILCT